MRYNGLKNNFFADVFHGDCFAAMADVEIQAPVTDAVSEALLDPAVTLLFCQTDYVLQLFALMTRLGAQLADRRFVLITHNSDYSVGTAQWELKPDCVVRWYALNAICVSAISRGILVPIPSGMERPNGGGYSSDTEVLRNAWESPRVTANLVYMNHNPNNNRAERDLVTRSLSSQPWVTWRPHGVPFPDYIRNCSEHEFVISPKGNGIDCHRTWEAAWMGATPIVKRSVLTDFFVYNLGAPFLVVEDWSLVTEELLRIYQDREKEHGEDYKIDVLKFSFWRDMILRDVEKIKQGAGNG